MLFLAGFLNGGGLQVIADVTVQTDDSVDNGYTFSVDLSTPRNNRRVFIPVHWSETGVHYTITSATINGETADIQQEGHTGGGTGFGCAILTALVPTGSGNQDVVIDFGGVVSGCSIGRVITYGLADAVATDTDVDENVGTATDLSDTISVPENGLVLFVYSGSTNTENTSVLWTGVTEVYDLQGPDTIVDGKRVRCSLALSYPLAVEAARAILADISNVADAGNAFVGQSWT